jgi:uncharacterized protein YjbI with pentapeptide repeats
MQKKKKTNIPKVLKPRLIKGIEKRTLEIDLLEEEDVISEGYISDYTFDIEEAYKISFEGVVFERVDFNGMRIDSLELTDVRFINCDLSNCTFMGSIIHRVEFEDCKMMGLSLNDSTLQNVSINNCNGRFALFNFIRMKNTIFNKSNFENCNIQSGKLDKVAFTETYFTQGQMSGTSLKDMDISSCYFDGVGLRPEDIKSAIVSPMQAVEFAKLLGVIIKE